MGAVPYGDGCPGRFPYRRIQGACLLRPRVPAKDPCLRVGKGTGTKSHTAVKRGIGVETQDDRFFMGSRQRRLFISIADNHVMGLAICYGAIIADDRIGISPFIDSDTLSQHLYMAGICYRIFKTINRIIGANTALFSYYFIIHTNNRCFLGIIRFISTTNGKRSSTAFAVLHCLQQSILQSLCRVSPT